jgi:hypothetical protein
MYIKHARGITFIEVLVWVTVFTFAMLAITSTLITFYRSNAYTIEQGLAVESARRGMARTVREMREIQYASNGAYPIVSIAQDSFTFYSDVDSDTAIERVRYVVEGTDFVRYVLDPTGDPLAYTGTETSSVVSDEVRNLGNNITTFTYYDTDGAVITDYSRAVYVRFVRLDLVVNVNPNRLPNELTLRSSATLRNLIER